MRDEPGPPLDLLGRVADHIGLEQQQATAAGRPLSSFAIAKALFESGFLAVPAEAAATETAVMMSGGGMHVRFGEDDEELERIYPLEQYIANMQRRGTTVYQRRILTVEDWHEVPETEPTKETPDA